MAGPPLLYSTYTTNPDATVDAHVLSLLSATSPLSYNSATGQFTIQQASGAQDGYLSSVDWNTFNSKQAPLTLPLSIANGGTNNTGPFTAGSVIFSNGTLLTQDNAALFWDDTNKAFCVGTVTQSASITVVAQIAGQDAGNFTAAARGVAAGAGGGFSILGGIGGIPASGAGGTGGTLAFTAGAGGSPTAGAGGQGGAINLKGGAGALATGTGAGGAGGTGGIVSLAGGQGGTSVVSGRVGGTGGSLSLQAGLGGGNSAGGTAGTGGFFLAVGGAGGQIIGSSGTSGTGGNCQFTGGAGGGQNLSTLNIAGGTGGNCIFSGGQGGPSKGYPPGAGGNITFNGGQAGTDVNAGYSGAGGNINFYPGQPTNGGALGKMNFGQYTTDIVNVVAGAGAGVPVNQVTPAAWIAWQRNSVAGFIPWYQ